jgi:hypothetical protein
MLVGAAIVGSSPSGSTTMPTVRVDFGRRQRRPRAQGQATRGEQHRAQQRTHPHLHPPSIRATPILAGRFRWRRLLAYHALPSRGTPCLTAIPEEKLRCAIPARRCQTYRPSSWSSSTAGGRCRRSRRRAPSSTISPAGSRRSRRPACSTPEAALAVAPRVGGALARGEPIGPLDGVPAMVKENIATAAAGAARHRRHELVPRAADAPPAARLREAGAVILGKTTMPDYGMLSSGLSSFHALTRNPWDLAATPAARAPAPVPAPRPATARLHIGTDIGGSVRLPAGWCGIFG